MHAQTETPADLYRMDEIAKEIAFRMVLSRETWPGDLLSMKRMFFIETETGIQFDYRQFGVIREASEPVQIHDLKSGEVTEYLTVRDMLRNGWMVD